MKRWFTHWPVVLPGGIGLLLAGFCRWCPGFAEKVMHRWIFPVCVGILGGISSLIPFSLTEAVCVAAIPAAITLFVCFLRKLRRSDQKRTVWKGTFLRWGWVLSVVVGLYFLMHGGNYYRSTAAQMLELDVSPKNAAQLQAVCEDLGRQATDLRRELQADEQGVMTLSQGWHRTLGRAKEAIVQGKAGIPFFRGLTVRPKGVLLSRWWSYTGITGMYFPFFAEANINIDAPDWTIPYTVGHELCHTFGIAREDEANFYAFLLTKDSADAEYRYSGVMHAFLSCTNALYSYDPAAWKSVMLGVSVEVRRDLQANNDYWRKKEGVVEELSDRTNDAFLKWQDQEDGVLSYGRVVELILAWYQKEGKI